MFRPHKIEPPTKGQLISKDNCQAMKSSKKQTNEFIFTTMRRIFVRFLEEIEDIKKTFRNYLTFRSQNVQCFLSHLQKKRNKIAFYIRLELFIDRNLLLFLKMKQK